MLEKPPSESALSEVPAQWKCHICCSGEQIDVICVPYVYRYLVAELAPMNNIRVNLEILIYVKHLNNHCFQFLCFKLSKLIQILVIIYKHI